MMMGFPYVSAEVSMVKMNSKRLNEVHSTTLVRLYDGKHGDCICIIEGRKTEGSYFIYKHVLVCCRLSTDHDPATSARVPIRTRLAHIHNGPSIGQKLTCIADPTLLCHTSFVNTSIVD